MNTTENQNDPKSPIATLVAALINDPEYAWEWHCNIAMACYDKGARPHSACNAGAALFLKLLTEGKVDTSTHPAYQQTQYKAPDPAPTYHTPNVVQQRREEASAINAVMNPAPAMLRPLSEEEKKATGLSEKSLTGALTTGLLGDSKAANELRHAFKDAPPITEETMESLRQATAPAVKMSDEQLVTIGVSAGLATNTHGTSSTFHLAFVRAVREAVEKEHKAGMVEGKVLTSLAKANAELERLRWRSLAVKPKPEDADANGHVSVMGSGNAVQQWFWNASFHGSFKFWRPCCPPPAPTAEEAGFKEFWASSELRETMWEEGAFVIWQAAMLKAKEASQ